MCVSVCVLHVCVFVFYLDRACKVRKDLRNYSTYGVNIPHDSRYHQHTTKPTISTSYGIFVQIGYKSKRNSHQLVMHVISSLCWKREFFFPVSPKDCSRTLHYLSHEGNCRIPDSCWSQKKNSPQGARISSLN